MDNFPPSLWAQCNPCNNKHAALASNLQGNPVGCNRTVHFAGAVTETPRTLASFYFHAQTLTDLPHWRAVPHKQPETRRETRCQPTRIHHAIRWAWASRCWPRWRSCVPHSLCFRPISEPVSAERSAGNAVSYRQDIPEHPVQTNLMLLLCLASLAATHSYFTRNRCN